MAKIDLSSFSLPDPAAIRARNEQMRQQQWGSGNPWTMHQATISNTLDSLFGNPEVRRAEKLQQVVTGAQEVPAVEGESSLDTELRRLASMRDAVADLDPTVASEINTRMLQLGQVKLEQDKLRADQSRAERKESREEKRLQIDESKEARATAIDSAKSYNFWRKGPNGIERTNVSQMSPLEIEQLRREGWVKGDGPNTEAEAGSMFAPTQSSTNSLQESLISARNMVGTMGDLVGTFDPSFLTIPRQLWHAAGDIKERVTGSRLSTDEAAKVGAYHHWQSLSYDALNRYINMITGAAMGVQEEVRIRKAFPDPQKDSPTQYIAKARATIRQGMAAEARAEQMLARGLTPSREQWDGIAPPPISDAEVDARMSQMLGIPVEVIQSMSGGSKPAAGRKPGSGFVPSASQQSTLNKYLKQ